MKITKERINKAGKRIVTVELDSEEQIHAIDPRAYYRTGYPLEDTVQGHIILDSERVMWCPIGQEWVS